MAYGIEIMFDGARPPLTDELREHANKRLASALRRFQEHIRHVRLRFEDVNGPKRGVDSRCLLIAQLTDGGRLVVEATTAWPTASVTRAARRLNEVLRRHIGRQR